MSLWSANRNSDRHKVERLVFKAYNSRYALTVSSVAETVASQGIEITLLSLERFKSSFNVNFRIVKEGLDLYLPELSCTICDDKGNIYYETPRAWQKLYKLHTSSGLLSDKTFTTSRPMSISNNVNDQIVHEESALINFNTSDWRKTLVFLESINSRANRILVSINAVVFVGHKKNGLDFQDVFGKWDFVAPTS